MLIKTNCIDNRKRFFCVIFLLLLLVICAAFVLSKYTGTFSSKKVLGPNHPVVEALHISKKRLKELIKEYPSSLLDKTYCFDESFEREFFDDAKREQADCLFEAEETVIFFIVQREAGRHGMGCSSRVVKIEKGE